MATAGGRAPRSPVATIVVLAVLLAALAIGCGSSDETLDPLLSRVNQSRDAQALSSLQQALVMATLVRTEAGSYGAGPDDLARLLQARDPSKRFGTVASSGPDQIQVVGGGAAPAMLVVQSTSENHLAIWSDGSATAYYRGVQPPALPAQRPAGGGWSEQPVVLRPVSG